MSVSPKSTHMPARWRSRCGGDGGGGDGVGGGGGGDPGGDGGGGGDSGGVDGARIESSVGPQRQMVSVSSTWSVKPMRPMAWHRTGHETFAGCVRCTRMSSMPSPVRSAQMTLTVCGMRSSSACG
jgi:hypothetical protein